MDINNLTVICPANDLEGLTIINICQRLGIDVRISNQKWGAKLGNENEKNLKNLKSNIILVEIPDKNAEMQLENDGHKVYIIDHHSYIHNGEVLNRYNSKSSLEQFSQLIKYSLNDEENLFALNDKSYLWELLIEKKLDLKNIKKIRKKDLLAQGWTKNDFHISEIDFEKRIIYENVQIVFTKAEKIANIFDMIYYDYLNKCLKKDNEKENAKESEPDADKVLQGDENLKLVPLNVLVITLDENNQPVKINFSGEYKYFNDFNRLVMEEGSRYNAWCGHWKEYSCFWGAASSEAVPIPILLDQVIAALIELDHPLLKFSTVFFYPFKIRDEKVFSKRKISNQSFWKKHPLDFDGKSELNYQEFVYFHTFVKNFIYGRSKIVFKIRTLFRNFNILIRDTEFINRKNITSFMRKLFKNPCSACELLRKMAETNIPADPKSVIIPIGYYEPEIPLSSNSKFVLVLDSEEKEKLEFRINHLSIHHFYNKIGILALQVIDEMATNKNTHLWEIIYSQLKTCPLRDAILFNVLGRILYWTFPEQQREAKIPFKMEIKIKPGLSFEHNFDEEQLEVKNKFPLISKAIYKLVTEFTGGKSDQNKGNFTPLLDDRMFVYSFFSFAGEFHKTNIGISNYESYLTQMIYVDKPQKEVRYERKFLRNCITPLTYKRWYQYGTQYGYTRFSAIYSGFGAFFKDETFNHFNKMYYQLTLIALFYRVSLLDFLERLSKTTQCLIRRFWKDNFNKLRKDFVRFTNIYWFQELTNQDQGIEIFDLHKKAFQFEELYSEIKEEIKHADELMTQIFQRRVTTIGLVLTFLTIIVGCLSINFAHIKDSIGSSNFSLCILITILIIGIMYFVIRYFKNLKN